MTQVIEQVIERLYKQESSKILAVLTRIFGVQNIELAEDVLQETFAKALLKWSASAIPENAEAWLMVCAKNNALDMIRAKKTSVKFSNDFMHYFESEWTLENTIEQEFQAHKIKDDQLRMIFMCCHGDIKPENRIVFILKNLCGLTVSAIAKALMINEATVKKRLLRTREKLKTQQLDLPPLEQLEQRIDSVHTVLYLVFNEGFHCTDNKQAINILFCHEAIALVRLLLEEPKVVNQETLGLLAVMLFQLARVNSRVDENGMNIPIDLQNRKLWDWSLINEAQQLLVLISPAQGQAQPQAKLQVKAQRIGRFVLEALIANEHCKAPQFELTNWSFIQMCYQQLYEITHSPIVQLNHAVSLGYCGKITQAIDIVNDLSAHKIFNDSHLPSAVLAHLYAKAGNKTKALLYAEEVKKQGGTPQEYQQIIQQVKRLLLESAL